MPGDRIALFDASNAIMYAVSMYQNGTIGVESYDLVRRQSLDPTQQHIQSLQNQVGSINDQLAEMRKMLEGLV
jgi:hypothetical protein